MAGSLYYFPNESQIFFIVFEVILVSFPLISLVLVLSALDELSLSFF